MLTQNRIDANRRNAALSTGPRTPEGKAISSRNNVKHGYYSTNNVIPALGESQATYNARLERFERDLQPVGELESSVLHKLVNLDVQLERFGSMFCGYYDHLAAELQTKSLIHHPDGTKESPHKTPDHLNGNTFGLSFALNEILEHHSRIQNRTFGQYFKTIKLLTELQKSRPPQPVRDEPKLDSTPAESTVKSDQAAPPSDPQPGRPNPPSQIKPHLQPAGHEDDIAIDDEDVAKEVETTNVVAQDTIK